MGLDMYAYSIPAQDVTVDVDFAVTNDEGENIYNTTELFYWRKFNALHHWMEKLYREKGGAKEFNCTNVRLTEVDLFRLEYDTAKDKLVPMNGFFFGDQTIYPEDKESIADFIAEARQAIIDGQAVFYDSWW